MRGANAAYRKGRKREKRNGDSVSGIAFRLKTRSIRKKENSYAGLPRWESRSSDVPRAFRAKRELSVKKRSARGDISKIRNSAETKTRAFTIAVDRKFRGGCPFLARLAREGARSRAARTTRFSFDAIRGRGTKYGAASARDVPRATRLNEFHGDTKTAGIVREKEEERDRIAYSPTTRLFHAERGKRDERSKRDSRERTENQQDEIA